jgi:biotin carboxyl carrier protein
MKMETVVTAPRDGRVTAVCCTQGTLVHAGTLLVALGGP